MISIWPSQAQTSGYLFSKNWPLILGISVLLSGKLVQAALDFTTLMESVRTDKIDLVQTQFTQAGESGKIDLRRYASVVLPAVAKTGTPAMLTLLIDSVGKEYIISALDRALVAAMENPQSTEITRQLLKLGANASAHAMGRTALGRAVYIHARRIEKHALKTVQLLLDNGADFNASEDSGMTPLMWACSSDDIPMIKLLLERGADPDLRNREGRTARLLAGPKCLALIQPTENATSTPETSQVTSDLLEVQALYQAVVTSDLEQCSALIQEGVLANSTLEDTGQSILTLAKNPLIFKLLLDHGADPNWTDAKGWTLLQRLVTCPGTTELVKTLLEQRANVQLCIENGQNSLLLAHLLFVEKLDSKSGREILNLLVKAGADINASDQDGETLLHLAAYNNAADLAQVAIELGADPEQPNVRGETPWSIATRLKAQAVLEIFGQLRRAR